MDSTRLVLLVETQNDFFCCLLGQSVLTALVIVQLVGALQM